MMKMGLYKLFSCNLEVQYKSYFLSKAMLFTILTTVLTIILPFVLAYRSRGKQRIIKKCAILIYLTYIYLARVMTFRFLVEISRLLRAAKNSFYIRISSCCWDWGSKRACSLRRSSNFGRRRVWWRKLCWNAGKRNNY